MANIGNPSKPEDSGEMAIQTFGLLRAYLGQRKYSQEWIDEAIGGTPSGRSKLTIVEDLKEALLNDI